MPQQARLAAPEWGSSAWDSVMAGCDAGAAPLRSRSHGGANGGAAPPAPAPPTANGGGVMVGAGPAADSVAARQQQQQGQHHSIPESELQQLTQSLAAHEALVVVSRVPPGVGIGRHALQQQPHLPPQQPSAQQRRQQLPAPPRQRAGVPSLNFAKLKTGGGPMFSKNLPEETDQKPARTPAAEAARLDASQRAFEEAMSRPINPAAPAADNRCYVYKAITPQERREAEALAERFGPRDGALVRAMWEALLIARRDCEAMSARGVRVARDVSRDWQETVSDLIDRVVAQDSEIASLKGQLRAAAQHGGAAFSGGAPPAAAGGASPQQQGTAGAAGGEDLSAQVMRLRRHRDRLARDNRELAEAIGKAQAAAEGAAAEAAAAHSALEGVRAKAVALWQQHTELLRHHIDAAAYAQELEAELIRTRGAFSAGGAASCSGDGGAFSAGGAPPAGRGTSGGGGLKHLLLPAGAAAAAAGADAAAAAAAAANNGSADLSVSADPTATPVDQSPAPAAAEAFATLSPRVVGKAAAAAAKDKSSPSAAAAAPGAAATGRVVSITAQTAGNASEGGARPDWDRRKDALADDQAPLPAPDTVAAAALQPRAMFGAVFTSRGGAAKHSSSGGGALPRMSSFDWRDDIQACKQQLEALSALFAA